MLLIVDTETTGLGPGHAVVELAAVLLRPEPLGNGADAEWHLSHDYFSTLVAPGRRISPEAAAVHHLRDADLRTAPHLPQAMEQMLDQMRFCVSNLNGEGGTVFAAHHAAFDRTFLGPFIPGRNRNPWLCTYRLASHLYPTAPSHSNQTLRYFLNLDAEVRASLPSPAPPPHRALTDALTTAILLKHMLATHTLGDLLALQGQPVLQRTIRFGKYRGQEWSQVPRDYLAYVLRQNGPSGFDPDILHTARHFLEGGS